MKTELTPEQSQHLINLGVPKEKASINKLYYSNKNHCIERRIIFKLEDFLNGEILPKEIKNDGEIADLCFDWNSETKQWCAAYSWLSEEYESHEEELIDALYELACWYYGEFLKKEKK